MRGDERDFGLLMVTGLVSQHDAVMTLSLQHAPSFVSLHGQNSHMHSHFFERSETDEICHIWVGNRISAAPSESKCCDDVQVLTCKCLHASVCVCKRDRKQEIKLLCERERECVCVFVEVYRGRRLFVGIRGIFRFPRQLWDNAVVSLSWDRLYELFASLTVWIYIVHDCMSKYFSLVLNYPTGKHISRSMNSQEGAKDKCKE